MKALSTAKEEKKPEADIKKAELERQAALAALTAASRAAVAAVAQKPIRKDNKPAPVYTAEQLMDATSAALEAAKKQLALLGPKSADPRNPAGESAVATVTFFAKGPEHFVKFTPDVPDPVKPKDPISGEWFNPADEMKLKAHAVVKLCMKRVRKFYPQKKNDKGNSAVVQDWENMKRAWIALGGKVDKRNGVPAKLGDFVALESWTWGQWFKWKLAGIR